MPQSLLPTRSLAWCAAVALVLGWPFADTAARAQAPSGGTLAPWLDRVAGEGNKVILAAYTGYCAYQLAHTEYRYRHGQISQDERIAAHFRRCSGYTLSVTGGWVGALGGTAVGAPFGPLGMVCGGVAGGVVGAVAGERLGFRAAVPLRCAVRRGLDALGQPAARAGAGWVRARSFLSDRVHLKTTRRAIHELKDKARAVPLPGREGWHLLKKG